MSYLDLLWRFYFVSIALSTIITALITAVVYKLTIRRKTKVVIAEAAEPMRTSNQQKIADDLINGKI